MSSGENRQENSYWSRDMSALLQIGSSTLRKWCAILEAQGYRFIRDDQDRRAFTDHDAIALRYFKELTQDKGVALESAAKAVTERFNRESTQVIAHSDTSTNERYNAAMERILDHVEQQEEFNKKLLQELRDQRHYIEESLNRRDQQLTQHIRESLETKKLLAAAEQKKSSSWWKLWKRGKESN